MKSTTKYTFTITTTKPFGDDRGLGWWIVTSLIALACFVGATYMFWEGRSIDWVLDACVYILCGIVVLLRR